MPELCCATNAVAGSVTFDVKRRVYDLCVNYDDRLLGLVESQLETGDIELDQSCCVRLYEIGRVRGDEDMVRGAGRRSSDITGHAAIELISTLLIYNFRPQ